MKKIILFLTFSVLFYSFTELCKADVIVSWDFEDQNAIADGGIFANSLKEITVNTGGTISYYSGAGGSAESIVTRIWDNGSGSKYWLIEFVTTGYIDLTISSKQRSSDTGPRDFKIQYKIGESGTWTDMSGTNITVADNFTSGVISSVSLPTACSDQSSVYLRWIMTSNTSVINGAVGSSGTSRIDDIIVSGGVLPVELTSFTSSTSDNSIYLTWTTAAELNNSGFEVERKKTEDNNWQKIGFVKGHGTTNTPQHYAFSDRFLSIGKFNYRLKQIDFNGNYQYYYLGNEVSIGVPKKFELSQNFPNPFNPVTKISYELPNDSKVSIKIFDMLGREVGSLVDEFKAAGYHTIDFDGSALSSGMYFYRIKTDEFEAIKKMLLVK